jgi:hypothetical protein
MGLGPVSTKPDDKRITLSDARQKAAAARSLLIDGLDHMTPGTPDAPRLPCKTLRRSLSSTAMNTSRTTRRSGKTVHRHRWGSTLKTYVHPVIGHLPVGGVDTGLVLKILRPIWNNDA